MKKIGIDARLISQTGVGTYLRNLLFYLQEIVDEDFLFYIYLLEKDYHKLNFKSKNFIKKIADFKWHGLREQIGYYYLLSRENLDLIHFPYFSYPVLYKKPFIVTIHDTTPLRFKTGLASTKNPLIYETKHLAFRYVLKNQVINSKKILTPSKSVAQELLKEYGQKYQSKIMTIYEGVNFELIKAKKDKSSFKNLTKKFKQFFIYVGNFYPHKNLERLVIAFKSLKQFKHNLILIGPEDFFKKKLLSKIEQLKLEKRIIFFHPKETSDLVFFYKNATALIHPSLSEGFGLPLVEAAYFNCPIIASNIPVFKELLKENYLAFDPYQINDIISKVKFFIEKKPKFDYFKILKNLSFKKMAQQTLSVYKNTIG